MPLVITLFALFASIFTLQKDTLHYTEPFFLIGARMSFAGILILAYLYFYQPTKLKFKLDHVKLLIIFSLLHMYLTNVFEIWGLNHMISSKACLIYSLTPFLAALIAFFVLKEKLSSQKWLGLCIGFAGLCPILFTQNQTEIDSGTLFIFTLAEISILFAVVCSVYGWILLKKLIAEYDYSPLMANGFSMLFGGVLALLHSYLSGENWQPIPVTQMGPFIKNSLLMCLISNLICYNLYGYLLKRFTATFMAFAGLVTPLFASLFGFVWLDEVITWHFIVAILFFSVGLYLFYQDEIKQGKAFRVAAKSAIK